MSDGHVTITLGRSGQKVVKRPRGNGGGARTDSRTFSGSKRSLENTFGSSKADGSLLFSNKRLRGDDTSRSSGRNSIAGARIGQEDLRLKLMRKRMSQSQRRTETREKTSRAVHSSEQSQRSSVSSIPLTRNTNELQRMESLRSDYSSRTSLGLPPKFPDTKVRASAGISAATYIEIPRVPTARRVEASETQRVVRGDAGPSRPTGPVPMPARPILIARVPVTELPSSSSMARSSRPEASPLTVSSFLTSLGLGKYAIHFQAEEVDMIALKQMGDRDLKELGLPMGPRKKILLAMLPPPRRPTTTMSK